jgi:hypothetical protein
LAYLTNGVLDGGELPESNTAHAGLSCFHTVHHYTQRVGDVAPVAERYPVPREIIDVTLTCDAPSRGHGLNGRLVGRGAERDPADLKWYQVRRIGRAAADRHVCAYQCALANAQKRRETFAWMLNKHDEGTDCATACAQAQDRFQHFWNSRGAALYDVIDESDGDPCEDRQRYDI